MMHPVPLPVRGASDKLPYVDQKGLTVPPGCLLNIVPFNAAGRLQMGTAPGVKKRFRGRVGTGPVQGLISVENVRTITGYTPSNCVMVTTVTSTQGVTTGNHFLMGDAISTDRVDKMDVTDINGPASIRVNANALHPDGEVYAISANYVNTVSGRGEATIEARDVATGARLWRHTITETGVDRFINAMVWTNEYLIVCTNQNVDVYKKADGSLLQFTDMNAWSSEAIDVVRTTNGATTAGFSGERVYVLFAGVMGAGTCNDAAGMAGAQVIEAGYPARHFRAGIMRFAVATQVVVDIGGNPLTQQQFGTPLASTAPFWEDNHGYYRISEQSMIGPRGCEPIALAADGDGNLFLLRTNSGYGPAAATWPADTAQHSTVTVVKISADGETLAEDDPGSVVEVGLGGGYNDIPTGAGDEPSFLAIAVDDLGDVYIGGRKNQLGVSVYKLRGTDLAPLWPQSLMPAGGPPYKVVREGGIAINAAGNPVIVGDENTTWTPTFGGAGAGVAAHLWELDAGSGAVVNTGGVNHAFAQPSSVSGLCILSLPDGRLMYGTDQF